MIRSYFKKDGKLDSTCKVVYAELPNDHDPNFAIFNFDPYEGDEVYQSLLDDTFVLTKNSPIYVAPGCPLPSADIRKNYTIKRDCDTGVCNVLSGLRLRKFWTFVTILPNNELMFFQQSWQLNKNDIPNKVRTVPGYEHLSLYNISVEPCCVYIGIIPEVYIRLFDGTLQKPAISYKKLDTNYGLELNEDTLELVYQAGTQSDNLANEKALEIELNALAQHNFRDYPRTMYVLTTVLGSRDRNVFNSMRSHSSRYGKNVKILLKESFPKEARNQDDFELAKRFMLKRLGLEDGVKYVRYDDVQKRMNECSIPLSLFHDVFDTIVRIKPKEYEATDNSIQEKQG